MLALHGFFNSSASYRVRIALALKNLPYDHVGVNIRSGVQNEPAYKALSPAGLVPTLQHGDLSITQSLAIIEWLDPLFAPGHWVPEQIGLAGGQSVLGTAGERSVEGEWDAVAAADPCARHEPSRP